MTLTWGLELILSHTFYKPFEHVDGMNQCTDSSHLATAIGTSTSIVKQNSH